MIETVVLIHKLKMHVNTKSIVNIYYSSQCVPCYFVIFDSMMVQQETLENYMQG